MLTHPTLDRLKALRLDGMAEAFAELQAQDGAAGLTHAEWLGLLADREAASRETKRLTRACARPVAPCGRLPGRCRLSRPPRPRQSAVPEPAHGQVDRRQAQPDHHRPVRGRQDLAGLRSGAGRLPRWHHCALQAHAAPLRGTRNGPWRWPLPRLFRSLTKTQLLILDDWGPDRLTAPQRRDLMEIIEERYERGSTMITSQLPVSAWHDLIGEPTFADAILDRIVHNAYRLQLEGQSMRKTISEKDDVTPQT